MSRYEDDLYSRPRRTALNWGTSAIIVILGLAIVGGVGSWAINLASQPGRVVQQTFDANNMIANYEWFRQQYQDVIAIDGKIAVQVEAQQAATSEAERTRIASIIAGLRTKRAQMVADYNARASMANRSIFQNPPLGGVRIPETLN